MEGSKLSLDMLVVHGVRNRIRNTLKVAVKAGLDVPEPAFAGLCAGLAVLTPQQKERGVLVVDLGGTEIEIDSRPSDAIALGVAEDVPIYVAEHVLAETQTDAGLEAESEDGEEKDDFDLDWE